MSLSMSLSMVLSMIEWVPVVLMLGLGCGCLFFAVYLLSISAPRKTSSAYRIVTEKDTMVELGAPQKKLRVCVIGAGASGLVAIKELRQEGHEVVCFEKYEHHGGVFYYSDKKGGCYDSTLLTISNYTMAFSDFPPPNGEGYKYWTAKEYYEYLASYAEHFHVSKLIRYNTPVEWVERSSCGQKWIVTTTGDFAGRHVFDAIAVCNGTHQFPKKPDIEVRGESNIKMYHSETYKNASKDPRFIGKRVTCIGCGETGADISHEIAQVASKAFLSLRRSVFVIPRYPWSLSLPGDAFTSRSMLYAYHPFVSLLHDLDQKAKMFTGNSPFFRWLFGGYLGLGCPNMAKVGELAEKSGGGPFDQFLTKNDIFIPDIVSGKLILKPGVCHIDGDEVVFKDGSREEMDVIMFNTGYVDEFPFLQGAEGAKPRTMYKKAFYPALGPTVCFIGFSRPSTGGIPAASEMTARYFALVCSNKRKLPDDWEARAEEDAKYELVRFSASPNIPSLMLYGEWMESVARHVGCTPVLWKIFVEDPMLWMKLFYGPMVPIQYRLRGPHAKPEQSAKIVKTMPTTMPIGFYAFQSISAIVSIVGSLFGVVAPAW